MATITNGNIDTACAAIAAPYGPFTRVTNITTLPTPNDDIRFTVTTALGHAIQITYKELLDSDTAIKYAKQASGDDAVTHQVILDIESLATYAASIKQATGQPYTSVHRAELLKRVRALQIASAYL